MNKIQAPRLFDTFYLHLTRQCNLRCQYCYLNAGPVMPGELSLEEYRHLFKEIILLAARKVVFTGGEPLLRTDLFDLAQAFRQSGGGERIHLCLISNGLLVDANSAMKIAGFFDEVRISLDGCQEINDGLRGQGSFQSALAAIHALQQRGLSPGVSITITSANLPHLEGFLTWLFEEHSVSEFHLAPFRPVGRGREHPELECSWQMAQQALAGFWRLHFGVSSSQYKTGSFRLSDCGHCGIGGHLNIQPDGSVYPCHVLSSSDFLLGNLRQSSLVDIVNHSDLLYRLGNVDFSRLKPASPHLRQLIDSAICLGEIIRDSPQELSDLLQVEEEK